MIIKVPVGPGVLGEEVSGWVEVDGDVVRLPGYEVLGDFLVHPPPRGESPYVISHVATGARVPSSKGQTRTEAIKNAVSAMDRAGIEKVKQSIKRMTAILATQRQ